VLYYVCRQQKAVSFVGKIYLQKVVFCKVYVRLVCYTIFLNSKRRAKMATTKQRQQAAKLARKAAKEAVKTEHIHAKVCEQVSNIGNDVEILESTPAECYDMFCDWHLDYTTAGDHPAKMDSTWLKTSTHNNIVGITTWLKIMYKGDVAGFFKLTWRYGDHLNAGEREIEVSYIKPQYRGLGLSSLGYAYSLSEYGCTNVSLSNHRIAGKCAYWKSLGFNSVISKKTQRHNAFGLAYVYTNNRGITLTEMAFKQYRLSTQGVSVSSKIKAKV
jgi:hypothetical protein